jgi:ribosomal protein L32
MAVPKKKLSVSRKKIRLNSRRYNLRKYVLCEKSNNFTLLHRRGSDDKRNSTNIVNKYNLDFL